MIKAFRVVICGRVTGVGFRYSSLQRAGELDGMLSGYIMNTGYGEVEAFIQGEEELLDEMIRFFYHGPSSARVDSVTVSETSPLSGLTNFRIK